MGLISGFIGHQTVDKENDTPLMKIKQNEAKGEYTVLILTSVKGFRAGRDAP